MFKSRSRSWSRSRSRSASRSTPARGGTDDGGRRDVPALLSEVDWKIEPVVIPEATPHPLPRQERATATLKYRAPEFSGNSYANYIMTYHPESQPEPNESGWFEGHETFIGKVTGLEGTAVMRCSGTIVRGKITGEWTVLEGSGQGGLKGMRGGGWYEYLTRDPGRESGKGGINIEFDEDKVAL